MHLPIVILEAISEPLSLEKIQKVKNQNLELEYCGNYNRYGFDYVGSEYQKIDTNELCSIYDNKVFELVQEDKERGINHVFRIKQDGIKYINKKKIAHINRLMAKINPENFDQFYFGLEDAIVKKFDTFITENDTIYLIDEWLLSEAEERQLYQIIQAFDSHL